MCATPSYNEIQAMSVGRSREKLRKRFKEAIDCLTQEFYKKFQSHTYLDFQNKRLYASDRSCYLQWSVRKFPDQPESYENQQTNIGTVTLIEEDVIFSSTELNALNFAHFCEYHKVKPYLIAKAIHLEKIRTSESKAISYEKKKRAQNQIENILNEVGFLDVNFWKREDGKVGFKAYKEQEDSLLTLPIL